MFVLLELRAQGRVLRGAAVARPGSVPLQPPAPAPRRSWHRQACGVPDPTRGPRALVLHVFLAAWPCVEVTAPQLGWPVLHQTSVNLQIDLVFLPTLATSEDRVWCPAVFSSEG